MRKILYISGTRADFGLMRNTLRQINEDMCMELEVIATGMHLMDKFGNSIDEIEDEDFKLHIINQTFKEDSPEAMSIFVGKLIVELTQLISKIKPDIILLLGDRGEMLAGAIVGSYLQIPVAQIHGGDISSTVDDDVRHAITKLSNIHLAATDKSASRILQMGESPKTVFTVGAPGLDSILDNKKNQDINELKEKYNIKKDFAIILQHPVSLEIDQAKDQIKKTLDAVLATDLQVILIYPNADAGGRAMIEVIDEVNNQINNDNIFKTYKNIPHNDFIGLLSIASVLIGNSSSGMIESSSFKLPVINIGSRQAGREKSTNVIDLDYDTNEILKAIKKTQSEEFRNSLNNCVNPYGEGKAYEKISNILKTIELNDDLLNKNFNVIK